MIYRSNLTAPDLSAHFRLRHPPLQIAGHDIPSDPDFEPDCGFWSHDEAAILYNCACRMKGSMWVDIGARLGWTGAHIVDAGHTAILVDPQYCVTEFERRCYQNIESWSIRIWLDGRFSEEFLREDEDVYRGFVIDGCHDAPEPLKDAQGCARLAADTAVILLHDALGKPVRDAARWLMDNGWKARMFWTPNGVIACWRGDFTPPDHVRDPAIDWMGHERLVYSEIAKEEWS